MACAQFTQIQCDYFVALKWPRARISLLGRTRCLARCVITASKIQKFYRVYIHVVKSAWRKPWRMVVWDARHVAWMFLSPKQESMVYQRTYSVIIFWMCWCHVKRTSKPAAGSERWFNIVFTVARGQWLQLAVWIVVNFCVIAVFVHIREFDWRKITVSLLSSKKRHWWAKQLWPQQLSHLHQ